MCESEPMETPEEVDSTDITGTPDPPGPELDEIPTTDPGMDEFLKNRAVELTGALRRGAAGLGAQQAVRPQQGDPWAHRSETMRCAGCMWFVMKGQYAHFGRCRRHAPTMSGYPAVFSADWCGDHKIDETKI